MNEDSVRSLLEKEVRSRATQDELTYARPDPLLVASRYKDEYVALVCALFGYGNAKQIVRFLESLDFGLLDEREETVRRALANRYYRFQKPEDVAALFIALGRMKQRGTIEEIFYEGYRRSESLLEGLWHFISTLKGVYPYRSYGYDFLVGSVPKNVKKAGTYKRYMMYLRWMVRSEGVDLGLWSKIAPKNLLMPLDTHTFTMAQKLGLLKRKSCDMKAVLELTERFRSWEREDPTKYDFALYRLGQEKKLSYLF